MKMDEVVQSCVVALEQRKTKVSYAAIGCVLGFGLAFLLFGFLDRTWLYYLEGLGVIAVAIVLFVVEACWRRIAELKTFLSEYVDAERRTGGQPEPLVARK